MEVPHDSGARVERHLMGKLSMSGSWQNMAGSYTVKQTTKRGVFGRCRRYTEACSANAIHSLAVGPAVCSFQNCLLANKLLQINYRPVDKRLAGDSLASLSLRQSISLACLWRWLMNQSKIFA